MGFRYYVVGQGAIGRRHAHNISTLKGDVVHLSARTLNLNRFLHEIASYQGKVAVIIATSTNIREQIITACAGVGAALYVEKPLAYKQADLDSIYALPARIKERSAVGFMLRYHPMVRYILDLGVQNIFRAFCEIGHDVNKWRDNWKFSESYAANSDGGGVLLDLCHEIDLACLFISDLSLEKVISVSHESFPNVDFVSNLILSKQNNGICSVAMDYLARNPVRRGVLYGLNEKVEYDFVSNTMSHSCGDDVKHLNFEFERNQMFLDLMKDFMEVAEGRKAQNPLFPSLDSCESVSRLISNAWQQRTFVGEIKAEIT